MILPQRAPVRPRIISPLSGDILPLEEEVWRLLDAGTVGTVILVGPAGTGKTTALRHLAAVLPSRANVLLLDERDFAEPGGDREGRLVIRASREARPGHAHPIYRLAPWGEDDLIEYLLATHKGRCAAVMARLRPRDRALCQGLPDLWRPVLDQLARDDGIPDVQTALRRYVAGYLLDEDLVQRTRSACLGALVATEGDGPAALERLVQQDFPEGLPRSLRHRSVQVVLAAGKVADDLRGEADCDALALRLPRDLVRAVADAVAGEDRCLDRLRRFLEGPPWNHAMAASLLHAAGADWVPGTAPAPVLRGAYLERVSWPGVRLERVQLAEANLTAADLRGADLRGAIAHKTTLGQVRLGGALLDHVEAAEADLAGADLSLARAEDACFDSADLRGANLEAAVLRRARFVGANLAGAGFRGSDLTDAVLLNADLEAADFSGANLERARLDGLRLREASWTGASFRRANLADSDLEGLDLPGACFEGADLTGALLTGCTMPETNFDGACLKGAGLGDVDWEGASLRGADLSGATFHMGSSRSGLVGSPIACEGSRTGFYTDDSEEQYYKAPEEIRKANLCRADLRGARLDGVDFYLVDLRGALYDPEQEEHLRRCNAILRSA